MPVADDIRLLESLSLGLFNFSNGSAFNASDSAGFLIPNRFPEGALRPLNALADAVGDFKSGAVGCKADAAPSETGMEA